MDGKKGTKRSQKKSKIPSKTIYKKKIVCHRSKPDELRALRRASVHLWSESELPQRMKRPDYDANKKVGEGDYVSVQTCCKKPQANRVLEMFFDIHGELQIVVADPPKCIPKRKGKGRKLDSDSDSEGEKSACQQKKHDLNALERKQKAEREELLRLQKTVRASDVEQRDFLLPSEITGENSLKVLAHNLFPLLDAKEGDFLENKDINHRDAGLHMVHGPENVSHKGAIKKKKDELSIATLEGENGSGTTVIGKGLSLGPQYPVGYWNLAEFSDAYFSEGYGLPVEVGNACKEPLDVSVWGLITEEDLTEIEGGECDRGDDQGDECAREYSWGTLCFPAKKNVVISQLSRLKKQGIKLLYFQVKNSGWVPSSADAWTCLDGQGNCVAELDLFTLGQWIDDEAYSIFSK